LLGEDRRIKHHPHYSEYAAMRIREKKLLSDQKEISEEIIGNKEDLKRKIESFDEANQRLAIARKKLDDVERKLRENMGLE
jgi:hypothetical protein